MKFWRPEILEDLPGRLLCALHRDMCRVRSGPWRPFDGKHPWIYGLPWGVVVWYHSRILREMKHRNWKPNPKWFDPTYRGDAFPAVNDNMVDTDTLGTRGWFKIFDSVCPALESEDRETLEKWKRRHL